MSETSLLTAISLLGAAFLATLRAYMVERRRTKQQNFSTLDHVRVSLVEEIDRLRNHCEDYEVEIIGLRKAKRQAEHDAISANNALTLLKIVHRAAEQRRKEGHDDGPS